MKLEMDVVQCPHSPSCFTCPLEDCKMPSQLNANKVNALPCDLDGAHIHVSYRRKKIRQYTLTKENETRVYNSEKEACNAIGACYGYISECIRNGKTCKGWTATRENKIVEVQDDF